MKNVLYYLRTEKKLTQADVAKKLNITQQAYQRYENADINTISVDTLLKMTKIFDVDISYILGMDKELDERTKNYNILNNIRRPKAVDETRMEEEREKIIKLIPKLSFHSCLEVYAYVVRLLARDEQENRYWTEMENQINRKDYLK